MGFARSGEREMIRGLWFRVGPRPPDVFRRKDCVLIEFARTWTSDRSRPALWRVAAMGLSLAAFASGGCVSRGNVEALEARLRQTQDDLRRSEKQLTRAQTDLDLARKETDLLQKQVAQTEQLKGSLIPEQTQALARIAGLSINKLMSGGKDRDGDRLDDAMQVIVSPLDGDGDLVKIAGQMEIEAYDMARTGDDKRIGRWVFDSSEARKNWHSGFLSSGYQFQLPWQQPPSGKNVLVHARLTTSDGRQFDTDQTLVVNVDPSGLPPGRSNLQLGAPAEPLRLQPPPQMQQVVEQTKAEVAQPLASTSRPLKRTAKVTPIASSMEDTTIQVGKASLDFAGEPDVPEVKRWPIEKGAEPATELTTATTPKSDSPIAKWAVERGAEPEVKPATETAAPFASASPWKNRPVEAAEPAASKAAAAETPKASSSPMAKWAADRDARPLVEPPAQAPAKVVPPAVAEPAAAVGATPWKKLSSESAPRETAAEEARPALVPPPRDPEAGPPLPPKRPASKPAVKVEPGAGLESDARPFPRGLTTTSDAWTDESIPRLR